jgi:dTDP-4-dehydrorhamnose reductase
MKEIYKENIDIWGGIECSYVRVNNSYSDQLEKADHYSRPEDLDRIADLGIKVLRYPIVWEKHCPQKDLPISWTSTEDRLQRLQNLGVEPIAGLVHHGSGPDYVSFYDGTFENGLAEYALQVAKKFPWIKYYTPVNEPLTTARFCGLYGHWYPHGRSAAEFLQVLISECKATVLAMQAIRQINPKAQLVQTEDMGKTHSTPKLAYQAKFENNRRWLSLDLLCGKVNTTHPLYKYLKQNKVTDEQLSFFENNPCPPSIIGINHYLTSERYIDENKTHFPKHTWGGNGRHSYADVEAVRVSTECVDGPYEILKEVWERYELPLAVTEVHLYCTREEQLRWFNQVWNNANQLKKEGADVRAITAWAIFGSFDWCSLLTKNLNIYEPGLFDVRATEPRATALTKLVSTLISGKEFIHPVMEEDGWWKRPCRIEYFLDESSKQLTCMPKATQPLLITGKTGTLGRAFERICALRGINCKVLTRQDYDITDPASIERVIDLYKPWAIINTAGYVRVDDAENDQENCFLVNTLAPKYISASCQKHGIKFVTFSSDLVFNGQKNNPYIESDLVSPLNIYGQSKAQAEQHVLVNNNSALIIRTSAFFGPWDKFNFVTNALNAFQNNLEFAAASDVTISPTYVPDLVNTTLDLLLDDENGIWNISNKGEVSWAMLAKEVAARSGFSPKLFKAVSISEMGLIAPRPVYSVLETEKGFELPKLEDALDRYFRERDLSLV